MILRDFANERHESPHTVATYIRRHPDVFDGHTGKKGNQLTLDDEAVAILDKIYPLPAPVEVIVDHESRDKLIKVQDYAIKLQKELSEVKEQLKVAETDKLMLEMETKDMISEAVTIAEEKLRTELNQEHRQKMDEWQKHYTNQIQDLENRLRESEAKSWWQKLKESILQNKKDQE